MRTRYVALFLLLALPSCSDDESTQPGAASGYEPGYAPASEAACAQLRAGLFESRAAIESAAPEPEAGVDPFEEELTERTIEFLAGGCYRRAGWHGEDGVHLTGSEESGDTHGWVRVWYSPEVYAWLLEGRPVGEVPDDAIIVKERFRPMGDDKFRLIGWQPMVRRVRDVADGWFWADVSQEEARHGAGVCVQNDATYGDDDFQHVVDCRPPSGFAQPCLRCHGTAPDGTYSQLGHLRQATGGSVAAKQTIYGYRELWSEEDREDPALGYDTYREALPAPYVAPHPERDAIPRPLAQADPAFVAQYFQGSDTLNEPISDGQLPQRFLDNVWPLPGDPTIEDFFLTSNQCWGCHSGVPHVNGATVDYSSGTIPNFVAGHQMLVPDGTFDDGRERFVDISPYGEWSVSMMGLSGRDPVFFAQAQWEDMHRSECAPVIADTCFGCHGVAGSRQLKKDKGNNALFRPDWITQAHAGSENHKYGALGRDGVTCTVCHRMGEGYLGTPASYTGSFVTGPLDAITGPYDEDVADKPMERSLGLEPNGDHAEVLKSAAMCGSCHAVKLPVMEVGNCNVIGEVYEQATFLEWRNSDYRKNDKFITDEGRSGATPKTCQDCHMPKTYEGDELPAVKIASVEDAEFPSANLEALGDVHADAAIEPRKEFSRHTLGGLNAFVLSMFQQYPRSLGIAPFDFMTNQYGEPIALQINTAIRAATDLAANTAELSIGAPTSDGSDQLFTVSVTNEAGHRLPTGVGFRRVVLQVVVEDASGNVVWGSGRMNDLGMVVGPDGDPLPNELADFEPHHEEIASENQVQIYEERVRDSNGDLTTSFLGIAGHAKDNRLMPKGWKWNFEPTMENGKVVDGVEPYGVEDDADYGHGTNDPSCGCDATRYRIPSSALEGANRVVARLYYQALPPHYLRDRFNGELLVSDAVLLAKYMSHLNTKGTPIEGWKLLLVEASRDLR